MCDHMVVSNDSAQPIIRGMEVLGRPPEVGIVSVQNMLNPVYRQELDVLEVCEQYGVVYLPWSPSKGVKELDSVFGAAATAHGKSTHAIALAWLRSLSPMMVPIPGVPPVPYTHLTLPTDLPLATSPVPLCLTNIN